MNFMSNTNDNFRPHSTELLENVSKLFYQHVILNYSTIEVLTPGKYFFHRFLDFTIDSAPDEFSLSLTLAA